MIESILTKAELQMLRGTISGKGDMPRDRCKTGVSNRVRAMLTRRLLCPSVRQLNAGPVFSREELHALLAG